MKIEIDITAEDFRRVLDENGSTSDVLMILSDTLGFFNAIPDKFISDLTDGQKKIITKHLENFTNRIKMDKA